MKVSFKKFFEIIAKDEYGITAVEYAILGSGIVLAIGAAVNALGTRISGKIGSILT